MKRVTWLVLLVVVLSAIIAIPASAITWGELDYDHHYVGAMVVDYTDIGYPDVGLWQMCSGTLIHERIFLTASHCTVDLTADELANLYVNFDPDAMNPAGLKKVVTAVTHPEYGWSSPDPHDIAILILEKPVEDIEPAQLPPANFLNDLKDARLLRNKSEGALFALVGYGGTLAWPPP